MKYFHFRTKSDSGKRLTDQEILRQIKVCDRELITIISYYMQHVLCLILTVPGSRTRFGSLFSHF